MNFQQTIFDAAGKPLGTAIIDTKSGSTSFAPRDGNPALAKRTWRSLAALKRALQAEKVLPGHLVRGTSSALLKHVRTFFPVSFFVIGGIDHD